MLQPGLADLRDRNDSRRFRAHLLLEEAAEFLSAIAERDEVKTADALGDLLVVILGTALVFDIPIEEVFNEIHKSNMTRSVASRLDRPMMKGPDFRRPDLQEVLKTARSKKS
jgi:predicted HAD superfamily Cof-like phosphohydrolase